MKTVRPVPIKHVHQVWPTVRPYIEAALRHAEGEALHSTDSVRAHIASGAWELFVIVDEENKIHGAGTVQYMNFPLHRVAFITTLGGSGVVGEKTFRQFLSFVKIARGVTLVQAHGRPSVVRLYRRVGLTAVNTLVEIEA